MERLGLRQWLIAGSSAAGVVLWAGLLWLAILELLFTEPLLCFREFFQDLAYLGALLFRQERQTPFKKILLALLQHALAGEIGSH